MNRIEKSIIESFSTHNEQSLSELMINTSIPKGTIKKYLAILVEKNMLKAIGEGRGRYYECIPLQQSNQIAVFKSAVLVGFLGHEGGAILI